MGESLLLKELLDFTRDGEWGKGEPGDDLVEMAVIRGTDFLSVRRGDISTVPRRFIPRKAAERKALVPSDILIETAGGTKDQPTGRTLYLSERIFESLSVPITCASFSRFLRPNQELVYPRYLFWYLQSIYATGEMLPYHIQHTGVARFQYTDFSSHWQVPLPPLDEQKVVADTLSMFENKIELIRCMNETLEAIARAIFKDWFVDFGPTRAKIEGRAPYLAPEIWELFPDALDGEGKPVGWALSEIGKEVQAVGGGTPSTKEPAYWDGGVHHWATPKDLSNLTSPVLLHTNRKITDAGVNRISSGILPTGTVIMSSRAPIGYLAITEVPTAVNQGFIAMVCQKRLPNTFVLFWCQENLDYIKDISGGSTFSEISKRAFRPVPVVMPSDQVLAAYDGLVRPLYVRIVANAKENETLAETRDLLLPKLMSGDVRLAEPEKSAETVA